MKRIYRKAVRILFAQAIKFEVSALQTRMMQLEASMKKMEEENQRLRQLVVYSDSEQDKKIAEIGSKAKAAFRRIGHIW